MEKLIRTTLEGAKAVNGGTNWSVLDSLTEEQIQAAIRADADSAPELREEWFKQAQWSNDQKEEVSIYLDHDVATFLRAKSSKYHFWLNETLKSLMCLTTEASGSS